jgi:hypothetical protein
LGICFISTRYHTEVLLLLHVIIPRYYHTEVLLLILCIRRVKVGAQGPVDHSGGHSRGPSGSRSGPKGPLTRKGVKVEGPRGSRSGPKGPLTMKGGKGRPPLSLRSQGITRQRRLSISRSLRMHHSLIYIYIYYIYIYMRIRCCEPPLNNEEAL